jgi:hypothetical protein
MLKPWLGQTDGRWVQRVLVVSVVLLTLPATACGTSSQQATTAKPEYVARVNGICARYNTLVEAVGAPSGTLEQQAAHARQVNAITRSEMAAVRQVPPPAGDGRKLADLLDESARAADLGDESARLILTDEASANRTAAQALPLVEDVNRKFAAYGLTTCAE